MRLLKKFRGSIAGRFEREAEAVREHREGESRPVSVKSRSTSLPAKVRLIRGFD
jgi:hypothetical protein